MLDMLIKQMLPPGVDINKIIADVQNAIVHVVQTVNRIETKIDALAQAQAATVPLTMMESNNDRQQQPDAASVRTDAPGADAGFPADTSAPGTDSDAGNPVA